MWIIRHLDQLLSHVVEQVNPLVQLVSCPQRISCFAVVVPIVAGAAHNVRRAEWIPGGAILLRPIRADLRQHVVKRKLTKALVVLCHTGEVVADPSVGFEHTQLVCLPANGEVLVEPMLFQLDQLVRVSQHGVDVICEDQGHSRMRINLIHLLSFKNAIVISSNSSRAVNC